MQVKNSVFLVTGGASGLGAATARMAVEGGGKVVLFGLRYRTMILFREVLGENTSFVL